MQPVEHVRKICLSLPQVTEKISHGEPAWFVGGRLFVMFADLHHDNRVACWCAAPEGAQQALIQSDPEHYFRPPYVGVRGWVGVYLDVPLEWENVEDVIAQAHQTVGAKNKKPRR